MAFFELITPRDMFEKLRRESQRLNSDLSVDNVFNFFVTGYHLSDYVRKASVVPEQALSAFLEDPDLKDCRDLCDKGKHLRLSKRADPKTAIWRGSLGGAPLNALSINGGDRWVLLSGDRQIDVEWLAERVIAKWRGFLEAHGL